MTNKFIEISQTISKKAIENLNGKLIFRQAPSPSETQLTINNISQKLENLEFQIVTKNLQEKEQYFQQLNALTKSIQKLERLYYRLLSTSLVSSLVLTILFLSMGLNPQVNFTAEEKTNLDASLESSNIQR